MDTNKYGTENTNQFELESEKTVKSKMPRQRKREFYNTIRKQMEFYFCDSNLSKDRFLMKLIKQDKYVPLETFLKFNKIKKLVTSTEDIAKALEHSEILQLNEDKSKVCRITEIPEVWDADNRTIYVESLPPTADHDWVKNVFSRFGTVTYVSLPRFKISKKIKEFGFIEFENEESVERALNTFKSLGSIITSNPENLTSITTFIKEKNEENQETEESKYGKKRKHSTDDEPDENLKRMKTDESESGCDLIEGDETGNESREEKTEDKSEMSHKKKKRRRKKKKSLKKSNEFDLSELKVLPKTDWKKLRNKYLNMQRKKFGEIKQELRRKRNNSIKVQETIEKRVEVKQPQSMNFYGAGQDNVDDGKNTEEDKITKTIINTALEKKPLFMFKPDLIVKIKMPTPCIDIKSFKADMRQYPGVMYVDVTEGCFEAFVRCESSKYAKNIKKRISCAEYTCELLSGDQEIEYWNKMMKDREMKFNKNIKIPYKRGKQKLAASTAKHIIFKDEE